MSKTYTGIQIGESSIKMVQVTDGVATKVAVEATPDNLVRDGHILSVEAMGEILKEMAKANQMKCRNGAIVLPSEICYLRRTSMPYMTIDQMKLNLPYEFRDYIHSDREEYTYDYAVVGEEQDEDGQIQALNLIIAAVKNDSIEKFGKIFNKAGFKLKIALPDAFTFRNIIREYENKNDSHPDAYCIVDMGHSSVRVHLYKGSVYETTRIIEYGGGYMDSLIAEELDIDTHLASSYKIKNYNNIQESEVCKDFYGKLIIEIFRSINFYNYNNPSSDLKDAYFCGGLAKVKPLMNMIQSTLEVRCHSIAELMPESGQMENMEMISAAIGTTMQ
ncbi:pilus assembly protein PilM [Anaerotignum sp.]|uniref:pilus assembly protein PilM n=1 Tax=Anaerotignum sp. TaxID=2039241 RepID=UPI0028A58E2B|nr:pilus assembly protein PilM [Anaerotignum sp.]